MYVNDLSFDPGDPYHPVPGHDGVRFGVQVFTTDNRYTLDPDLTRIEPDGDGCRLVSEGLSWAGGQRRAKGLVEVRVGRDGDAVTWRIAATVNGLDHELVKAVKLVFAGLPADALAAGWWTPTTPSGEVKRVADGPVRLRYPWPEWLTPWACAGDRITVSMRDTAVRAMRLYAFQPPYVDGPLVELVCAEDARRRTRRMDSPEFRLRFGAPEPDLAEHLGHVERTYGLTRWEERKDVPAWVSDIRLQVTLHGQHWTGYVFNTFDRMADALRLVTRHIPGHQVLAYLPGWEGRYYHRYPIYAPGPDLGGEDGFARLAATARQLGVHLMPMFGANGARVEHYPDWRDAVFRSPSDRYVTLVNSPDWDTDRTGEDEQIFLNPGEPGYRGFLLDQVDTLVRRHDLDAVFFDTSACWFNDPRHNLYDGYRALTRELRTRHPDLLLAGEGWYDALLACFPVNQTWLDIHRPMRAPDLLNRYARVVGHLADGCPGYGSTGVHEGGFNRVASPDVVPPAIPSLGFVNDTLDHHADDVAAFCRAAALASADQTDQPPQAADQEES